MNRTTVFALAALTLAAFRPLQAQTQSDTLADLQRKIDILAEEIDRLKTGEVLRDTVGLTTGLGPAASRVYGSKIGGVSLASYGEALYQNFDATVDDGASSDKKDQIDYLRAVLYVGHRFNDWILFNSEIEFEHASTGKGGEVSVELAYIELLLSRAANLRTGLLLIPVGIINEKHEPTTYFGTARPRVEQLIIPTTWRALGIGSYGEITEWLNYRAYVVEGLNAAGFSGANGIRGGRQSGARAVAEDFGATGRIEVLPLPELTIGADFFAGNSGQGMTDSLGEIRAWTSVWSTHVEFAWNQLQLRGLYARTSVSEADRISQVVGSTVGSAMDGWYASAGYDVMPLLSSSTAHALSPYVIYEEFNTHARVPAGSTQNAAYDGSTLTLGLMYSPTPGIAFKADYRDNTDGSGGATDQWNLAIGYLF